MAANTAASIRQRLLNLSRDRNEAFDFVLKVYLIQRLLYRLGVSTFNDRFLLKGAMLFWVWAGDSHRPTRDIDLLGFGNNDIDALVADFQTICKMEADDGLVFNLDSIKGIEIKEEALYQGIRITGKASLDGANISFQVDIGFGDVVTPEAELATLPSYLDLPEAELKVYPVYTVIAEKFQAMVILGVANSRIKDFYDLWVISTELEIDGNLLLEAIKATFERRETPLSEQKLSVFKPAFAADKNKQKQWVAFLRKNGLESDMTFEVLMGKLQDFLEPVYTDAVGEKGYDHVWLYGRWN